MAFKFDLNMAVSVAAGIVLGALFMKFVLPKIPGMSTFEEDY